MSLAPRHAIGLLALLVALPGCFATTKHVRQIEQDMTREHAWTDEQVQSLQADLTAVRSENNALRTRMADLESQLTSLGGEVSDRIHELSQSDQEIGMQIAETSQRADALDGLLLLLVFERGLFGGPWTSTPGTPGWPA